MAVINLHRHSLAHKIVCMSYQNEATAPQVSPLKEALQTAGVVFGGFIVLGMGLGVLIASLGLPWWIAPLISLFVLAGSAEFVLVGLMASATPLTTIATTTALINSRHLVYGISYPLQVVKGFWGKLYAVYSLCDEAFALNVNQNPRTLRSARVLWIHLGLHLSWATGSTLGALVGAGFLSQLKGIDFVMTALFIALALDAYRQTPDRLTLVLALFSGVVGLVFFHEQMLLVTLLLFIILSTMRHFMGLRREATSV